MKKLIDVPDNVLLNLNNEAKKQKRTLKAHLEYIIIMESNKLVLVRGLESESKQNKS